MILSDDRDRLRTPRDLDRLQALSSSGRETSGGQPRCRSSSPSSSTTLKMCTDESEEYSIERRSRSPPACLSPSRFESDPVRFDSDPVRYDPYAVRFDPLPVCSSGHSSPPVTLNLMIPSWRQSTAVTTTTTHPTPTASKPQALRPQAPSGPGLQTAALSFRSGDDSMDDSSAERPATPSGGAGGLGGLRGIDMNQVPCIPPEEEAELRGEQADSARLHAHPSLLVKREREPSPPRPSGVSAGNGNSDEEEGTTTRKKLRLTREQSQLLEQSFKEHTTLNPKQKNALARQLNLRPRQVEVWFQNRRARTKLKQTEVDFEVLKRFCETLKEENRKLHKELQDLKSAIKVVPPCIISQDLCMPLTAATLAMCPSCERITSLDSSSNGRNASGLGTGLSTGLGFPKAELAFLKPTIPGFSHFAHPPAACS
ncbi:hypothetical protein CBR_g39298 [Chara braunii]|uniref:Homeobox domain-containing protein n=1 Tax=Chara braunii TaxID=69332 RepID=A0A388K123_CHABU|nr:hypothetical protein CBR_g39298 [Chara braunii]|eukprot:GBG63754.1 hypothetical protein CBR_g39298 [Chara braunii]